MQPLLRLWMKGAAIVLLCCVFTWHVQENNRLSLLPNASSTLGFPRRELHGDAGVRDAEGPEYVRPVLQLPPLRLGDDAPSATFNGSEGQRSSPLASNEAPAIATVPSPSASHAVSVSPSTSSSPTPAPSTSPALDVEIQMLAVSTRKHVHERYRLYGESRKNVRDPARIDSRPERADICIASGSIRQRELQTIRRP